MITEIEALNARGETLSLPLEDSSGGYIVEDVDGLGPVKATISSSSTAQLDGVQFQNIRREARNIQIKLGFDPDYVTNTVESLRARLYGFFMPKSFVKLKFYRDGVLFVQIDGYVESCEPDIFTQDPIINVSILNPKPDFVAPSSVVVPGLTVSDATELDVAYPGSTETGFLFTLNVDRPISGFTLYNGTDGGAQQQMEFVGDLIAGDILALNTVQGSKYARLTRAGVQSSVLWGIAPATSWMVLTPWGNHFRAAVGGASIPFTIEYTAKYGGL